MGLLAQLARATPDTPDALDLMRGPLLQDLSGVDPAFDCWLNTERKRLLGIARTLAETIIAQQTEPAATLREAKRLLRIDPTHEGGWRAVIAAHLERGEHGLAVGEW